MLARAGEGFGQWRALALTVATSLGCVLLFWLMNLLGSQFGGFGAVLLRIVFGVLIVCVGSAGFSASGILLMDKAREQTPRSMRQAFGAGLRCVPRFLLLALCLLGGLLAIVAVAAVVYLLCRIPLLGAVLGFIAQPVLVAVFAAYIIVCLWVVAPLFAPAVWSGLDFRQAAGQVWTVARTRLLEVVLLLVALYVVVGAIGLLLASGLLPASGMLTVLAGGIVGSPEAVLYMPMGNGPGVVAPGGSGALLGMLMGVTVLAVMLSALLGQVIIMGLCLIYLQVAAAQASLPAAASELQGTLAGWGERARRAADKARATAAQTRHAVEEKIDAAAAGRRAQPAPEGPAAADAGKKISDFERELDASLGLAAAHAAPDFGQPEPPPSNPFGDIDANPQPPAAQKKADGGVSVSEQQRLELAELEARAQALAEQEQARLEQQQRLEEERQEQERLRQQQLEREQQEHAKLEQQRREQAEPARSSVPCIACGQPVAGADLFCEHCGARQR